MHVSACQYYLKLGVTRVHWQATEMHESAVVLMQGQEREHQHGCNGRQNRVHPKHNVVNYAWDSVNQQRYLPAFHGSYNTKLLMHHQIVVFLCLVYWQ
jgi:hypothetical protein